MFDVYPNRPFLCRILFSVLTVTFFLSNNIKVATKLKYLLINIHLFSLCSLSIVSLLSSLYVSVSKKIHL
jgi:hypothetical protein